MRLMWIFFSALMFAHSALAAPAVTPPLKEVRYVMGTLLEVSIYLPEQLSAREVLDGVFKAAQEIESVLSNYREASEVSRLNGLEAGGVFEASPELFRFVKESQRLSDLTAGAFDMSVRPLVELWSKAQMEGTLPGASEISEARRCLGRRHQLGPGRQLKNLCAGLRIETGGIGKGYAVDRMVDYLRDAGVRSALVHFGRSSSYALGAPPGQDAWELLVQFQDESPLGRVRLKDAALSASDTMGRPFQIAGKTFGHMIDPMTGELLQDKRQAVVVAKSACAAEALSKYLVLRGLPGASEKIELGIEAALLHKGHVLTQTLPALLE